jgi:hypothetical protein
MNGLLCWHDITGPTPWQPHARALVDQFCFLPVFDKPITAEGGSRASTGLTSHPAFLDSSAMAWTEQAVLLSSWEWCEQALSPSVSGPSVDPKAAPRVGAALRSSKRDGFG